jgi:NAD(P)-dependent dehydrogenase (short-subunit alcohol dehydrogenase family)
MNIVSVGKGDPAARASVGTVALVTGSTSGIGLGVAKAFAAAGASIALDGLGDAAEIEATRSGIESEHCVPVDYRHLDRRHQFEPHRWQCTLLAPQLDKEDHTKDIDFSNSGIKAGWNAAYVDTQQILTRLRWEMDVDPVEGFFLHELRRVAMP